MEKNIKIVEILEPNNFCPLRQKNPWNRGLEIPFEDLLGKLYGRKNKAIKNLQVVIFLKNLRIYKALKAFEWCFPIETFGHIPFLSLTSP